MRPRSAAPLAALALLAARGPRRLLGRRLGGRGAVDGDAPRHPAGHGIREQ